MSRCSRILLEGGIAEALRAKACKRLKKEDVGTLVQMASEYADMKKVSMAPLAGVPWLEKPEALRHWLITVP